MPIDTKLSVSTFQQCDGSNFSTAGVNVNKNFENGYIGGYLGAGTSFKENTTGVVFDVKGGLNYGDSGVSGGFRVRNNINPLSKSVQVRLEPITVKTKLTDNATLYTTPYVATKFDGDAKTTVGNFTGISVNVGKRTSVFVEGQIYDVTNVNKNTSSVNVGLSVKI